VASSGDSSFDFITLVVKVQKADSDKVIVVLKFSINQSNNLKTIGSFCALSKNCEFFEGFGKTTTRNFLKFLKAESNKHPALVSTLLRASPQST
jgi:hypothetical protein